MHLEINQINILSILDKLGFQYKNLGNGTFGIIEDGKLTDGYRVNTRGNYLRDFSKDRIQGPPFIVVKEYLNLDNRGTYLWFETEFGIKSNSRPVRNRGSPKQKKNKVIRPYSRTYLTIK